MWDRVGPLHAGCSCRDSPAQLTEEIGEVADTFLSVRGLLPQPPGRPARATTGSQRRNRSHRHSRVSAKLCICAIRGTTTTVMSLDIGYAAGSARGSCETSLSPKAKKTGAWMRPASSRLIPGVIPMPWT